MRPLGARSKPVALLTTTIPLTMFRFYDELIRQLFAAGYDVRVVSSDEPLLKRVSEETGARAHRLNMARDISLLADLRALLQWLWLCVRVRPELLVAATPKASLLSLVAAKLVGVPRRVYFLFGLRLEGAQGRSRQLLAAMERLTSWSSSEVVANSSSLARRYLALGLAPEAKVRRTYPGSSHGVDTEHYRPQEPDPVFARELGLKPDIPVVGFIGRLTRDKGIDSLLEALSLLRDEGRDAQLLVVGPQIEPDSAAYVERLKHTGVPVAFVDMVDDVRPYFALMDIHVLPSLREGFPNVVLEASAMGLPTVTTDATGCVDSVRQGETGLIVKVQDSEELAGAIRSLLDHPATARRYGAAARQWVVSSFQPAQVVRTVLAGPADAELPAVQAKAG